MARLFGYTIFVREDSSQGSKDFEGRILEAGNTKNIYIYFLGVK